MKAIERWVWALASAMVLAVGCGEEAADVCGAGDEVVIDEEAYCVYRQAVVVENGFACPVERPNLVQEGGIGVCSGRETVPGGLLERIGVQYREQNPELEGCILDFECTAPEVCYQGGCVAPANNSTTNNTSTNNTSTNNTTTGCTSSADCGSGELCEGGVCLGACGGFAGFTCAATEWCDYPDDSICGAADQLGTCRPRPEVCIDLFEPVCGCDGMDYGNSCDAEAAGTDVASAGMCP